MQIFLYVPKFPLLMSSNSKDIGRKINDKGWIDFQESPRWRKPVLSLEFGNETTFWVSNLKYDLKDFIDVDKIYFFQGIIINPEVDVVLGRFKQYEDKITPFKKNDNSIYQLRASTELAASYLNVLKQELSKDEIDFISYPLATRDEHTYIPGLYSWPTIFITSRKDHQNLVNKVNSLTNSDFFKKDNSKYTRLHAIISNANIPPLVLDEDTSLEVEGSLVQKMSNLLFTYSAKYKMSSHSDGDL
jgi:hypothetical protein